MSNSNTDRIVEIESKLSKKLCMKSFIVWTSMICFVAASAVYAVDQKVSACAKIKDTTICLTKISDKLEAIRIGIAEIRAGQHSTDEYIKETKKRDARQDLDIQGLKLENARRENNLN